MERSETERNFCISGIKEEQLFHCEPQMNADERGRPACRGLIRVHPCPSAVCESCFPRKKSRKTFGRLLT